MNKKLLLRASLALSALALTLLIAIATNQTTSADSSDANSPNAAATPLEVQGDARNADWLEMRGINIADLVGVLPENVLKDSIITWVVGNGIVRYESGNRSGGNVSLSVYYDLDQPNALFCLAKEGIEDDNTTAVPPMNMRVFDGNTDVTHRVNNVYQVTPAGDKIPDERPAFRFRYNLDVATIQRNGDGSISLPANLGCRFTVDGPTLNNPRAEFSFTSPQYIQVELIHEAHPTFRSYVGGGAGGSHSSLRNQMVAKYGFRHDGWKPEIYGDDPLRERLFEADYIFFKFPPQPHNPFAGETTAPGSGTYRVMFSNGLWFHHSHDHQNSMLLPFHTQWRDADMLDGNEVFRPTHKVFDRLNTSSLTVNDEIKAPEYFLPPGVDYHPCMTNGGCSDSLLQQVYNASYQADIYFYKVERIYPGLAQVPIKMVGDGYVARSGSDEDVSLAPTDAITNVPDSISNESTQAILDGADNLVYLPFAATPFDIPPDVSRPDCPCGWFDEYGRMFDFVPAP